MRIARSRILQWIHVRLRRHLVYANTFLKQFFPSTTRLFFNRERTTHPENGFKFFVVVVYKLIRENSHGKVVLSVQEDCVNVLIRKEVLLKRKSVVHNVHKLNYFL